MVARTHGVREVVSSSLATPTNNEKKVKQDLGQLAAVRRVLRQRATPVTAQSAQRFFKTGPGQYGAGDQFLGVTVPQQRVIVKQFRELSLSNIKKLLKSNWHEERLVALLILVEQFKRAEVKARQLLVDFYLTHTAYVNNWDLVDSSADKLLGEYLYQRKKSIQILRRLAHSEILWERRIAMIATYAFIKHGDPQPALDIARLLVHDQHDLIQKAVGWMIREVGKRCAQPLANEFLERYAASMPRTMLRYAIEHLSKQQRQYFLNQ